MDEIRYLMVRRSERCGNARRSLKSHSHLEREEIAEKPEVSSADLDRLLGSGAQVIEKLILKNLYCKLQLKYEKEDYGFSDYIKELRKKCGC